MGKKDQKDKNKERVEAVLELLRKQAPLTLKQEKFCNNACVERFLKARGDSVKKAAKHLRACLSWRDSISTGTISRSSFHPLFHRRISLSVPSNEMHSISNKSTTLKSLFFSFLVALRKTERLIADEFSTELSEGFAYVAGHDHESRPVMIFRIKQDYQKFHSQKLYIRLLVFTLEVAIGSMPRKVKEFVLLFDASFFRSASAFMNLLLATLKIVSEYYPGRLHRAFVIDPPSLFSYLWKGVRPFVELSTVTMVVYSLDFEESLEYDDFSSLPRASAPRFDPSSIQSTARIGACSSSRFSFTVSHQFDSVKPWYLSLTDTSASKVGPTSPSVSLMGPALISPLNARSFSFASPAARTPRGNIKGDDDRPSRKNIIFPSTPLPHRINDTKDSNSMNHPRTPRPSFLQSPAMFFKDCHVSKSDKSRESFRPFLRFYRRPYDEMGYRSKMRPALGGLVSVVSPHLKRRHVSASQRF
ncbi:hypothetical protein HHK36_020612 [Tetracentron sinense]|uniref:CRAL-TRIO domain-containing protein n=1 Tax=Tetracentron sinense TaxID=13715 RepID=A0A834YRX4_TETSI|nr:hypothetical protein HHK36_020612 [Tetracentron sinense]